MLHKFQHSGKLRHKDQEFLAMAGEMAKQERAFAALSEDPGLIPSNCMATHNPPGTHMVHRHIHAGKISTHINERERERVPSQPELHSENLCQNKKHTHNKNTWSSLGT